MIRLCIGNAPPFLALLSVDDKLKPANRTMDDLGTQHDRRCEMIYSLMLVQESKAWKLEIYEEQCVSAFFRIALFKDVSGRLWNELKYVRYI
jgi:hypothetical protein